MCNRGRRFLHIQPGVPLPPRLRIVWTIAMQRGGEVGDGFRWSSGGAMVQKIPFAICWYRANTGRDISNLWPAIEEFRLKISVPTAFRWLCGAAVALKVEVSYACVNQGERVEAF